MTKQQNFRASLLKNNPESRYMVFGVVLKRDFNNCLNLCQFLALHQILWR